MSQCYFVHHVSTWPRVAAATRNCFQFQAKPLANHIHSPLFYETGWLFHQQLTLGNVHLISRSTKLLSSNIDSICTCNTCSIFEGTCRNYATRPAVACKDWYTDTICARKMKITALRDAWRSILLRRCACLGHAQLNMWVAQTGYGIPYS
jgi:hypothetical protein